MRHQYRWNSWNVDPIAAHGVSCAQAESVIDQPAAGFPREIGNGKYLVQNRNSDGNYLQAIYVFDPPGVVFVIHARWLTDAEKRRFRRGRKRKGV